MNPNGDGLAGVQEPPLITVRATGLMLMKTPQPDGTERPMLILTNGLVQMALLLEDTSVAKLLDELGAAHARSKLSVATEMPPDLRG